MADSPRLLTATQVCRRLGVTTETFRVWRLAGRAPQHVPNMPGRKRWRVSDIDAFEQGRYGAEPTRSFFTSARRKVSEHHAR